jgi:hypothetical protein
MKIPVSLTHLGQLHSCTLSLRDIAQVISILHTFQSSTQQAGFRRKRSASYERHSNAEFARYSQITLIFPHTSGY